MDLKEELTRQSLLLEFISACVGVQEVPELARLITVRLHWICEFDGCTALLPGAQGLSLWSEDRKAGAAARIEDAVLLSRHRRALEDAMASGSPAVARHDDDMILAAFPLGSDAAVHGALCVARAAKGFSHGDLRHLQHAARTLGGALARIASLAAERAAERSVKLAESALRAAAEDRVLLAEQMMGIVSHDLRNPLSAILTGAGLLGRGEPLSEKKERVLHNVGRAARRAHRLVDDLLDFTQARVGKGLALNRAEVDLDELLVSIVDELRLSFAKVELRRPGQAWGSAYLDADRIHQLLGNMVSNAAKYGAPDKPILVECGIGAGELVLSVCNEGKPIPEAMFASMFEPMMRGPGLQGGRHSVGLGLYIVRAIAESHAGTVEVSSSAEGRTCFSLRMPVDCRAGQGFPPGGPAP